MLGVYSSDLHKYFSDETHILGLNGTGTDKGNRTGRIEKNGSWSLSLSQTSELHCAFHLVPVLFPIPFSSNVNKPLE